MSTTLSEVNTPEPNHTSVNGVANTQYAAFGERPAREHSSAANAPVNPTPARKTTASAGRISGCRPAASPHDTIG